MCKKRYNILVRLNGGESNPRWFARAADTEERMRIFLGYALTYGWVVAVMAFAQLTKSRLRASDETSRKLVHILVALAWIPMYLFFGMSVHLLVPPLTFVVLNYISYKKDIFSMMERKEKTPASLGTVYYPVSMAVLSGLSLLDGRFLIPYGIGLFCMAFGDGLAPYAGHIKKGNAAFFGGRRTLLGTLTVFAASAAVAALMTLLFSLPLSPYEIALTAAAAALFEAIGLRGFDNLTLPVGVGVLSWIFIVY